MAQHVAFPEPEPEPEAAQSFGKGDAVEAQFRDTQEFFPGRIEAVRDDGTYDSIYDEWFGG